MKPTIFIGEEHLGQLKGKNSKMRAINRAQVALARFLGVCFSLPFSASDRSASVSSVSPMSSVACCNLSRSASEGPASITTTVVQQKHVLDNIFIQVSMPKKVSQEASSQGLLQHGPYLFAKLCC